MDLHRKILMPLSHWPTLFLLIGYPVFWLEMFVIKVPGGHTSVLAWILVFAGLAVILKDQARDFIAWTQDVCRWVLQRSLLSRIVLGTAIFLMGIMIAIIFYASLLPPHLAQEFDAINYHITMPRQHLISGSFAHLTWSTADLYFLPLDFALAPFWLVTSLPNKFPQFIFFLGLLAVSARLCFRLGGGISGTGFWVVCSILGLHMVGIQAGTAMLDMAACYLLVAALESFLSGYFFLSVVEFTFLFWSKSFLPPETVIISSILIVLCQIMKRSGFRICWGFKENNDHEASLGITRQWKKWVVIFFIVSTCIGGPFVAKSLYYSGTPLFPFGIGMVRPFSGVSRQQQEIMKIRADQAVATKDQYGSGRTVKDFLIHFWLIAVPEKGVNNRYDYPVGLVYLLLAGPFLYYFFLGLYRKVFSILPGIIILYWGLWWLAGSHQTRFLYIPIILMIILVLSQGIRRSIVLKAGLLLSLAMTTLSVYGAHRSDLGKSAYDVLRAEDKKLVGMPVRGMSDGAVTLNVFDVAFASFPVDVKAVNSVFVLSLPEKKK